jgi:hypothetical protein
MGFDLPNPGDLQGQVDQGSNLVKALQNGDVSTLGAAGMSLAKGIGGTVGADLAGLVSAAGAGAAVGAFAGSMAGLAGCGPYGAIAAAIITAVVELENAFTNNYQGVKYVYPPEAAVGGSSAPSVVNANRIANWPVPSATGNLDTYGNPPGLLLAQYLSVKYPPKTTRRAKLAFQLMQEVAKEVLKEGVIAQNQIGCGDIFDIVASSNPLMRCGVVVQSANPCGYPFPVPSPPAITPEVFMSPAGWGDNEGCQAMAPPLFWHWLNWQEINPGKSDADPATQTYPYNLFPGGKPSSSSLWKRLIIATAPLVKKITPQECLTRALQRAPDPLFFDVDLYGAAPNHSYTIYYNIDLMKAVATVCAMLSKGLCTRGIVAELLVQASILTENNALGKGVGNANNVSPGFRALLDDYLALAHLEDKYHEAATMASITGAAPMPTSVSSTVAAATALSTGEKIGAVATGAAGALLAGVLAYSAYTRTSPVETAQLAVSRTRKLVHR